MPIYEYLCQDCGHKLEVMQRISDPRQTTCPSCGHEALKKLISAVGFQLKGTGWYETDFKHGSKGKVDKSGDGGDGPAKPAESTEKKSDSTETVTKTEPKPSAPAASAAD